MLRNYPITVLGVLVDKDVVVVGEYVVIKVPFFVPYESSVSLFNFTVYIYYNDKLVYFAWRELVRRGLNVPVICWSEPGEGPVIEPMRLNL